MPYDLLPLPPDRPERYHQRQRLSDFRQLFTVPPSEREAFTTSRPPFPPLKQLLELLLEDVPRTFIVLAGCASRGVCVEGTEKNRGDVILIDGVKERRLVEEGGKREGDVGKKAVDERAFQEG
jgi:hypothetical protein